MIQYGIECDHHDRGNDCDGIMTYPLQEGETFEDACYRITRSTHQFLDDTNHSWTFEAGATDEYLPAWSHIVIRKNENSPRFLLKPEWITDGPGCLWTSCRYRVMTDAVAEFLFQKWQEDEGKWQTIADGQKDTIRGRKSRKEYLYLVSEMDRYRRVFYSRWPQHNKENV